MAATSHEESSDYDSSDISFASSSSISVRSASSISRNRSKPHKANQAEWEAISHIRAISGQVRLDHFQLIKRLGGGDLGNVYLCKLRDARVSASCFYAMKVVDREALAFKKKIQRAETEKEILRSLDHPFLPTLYADFDASHYSCLVMEFCPGGDLHVVRQRQPTRCFSVNAAKFYAAETILALEYLHMMGVVYRDLKPENVLVRDDGHIMLSDFDLSLKCDVVPKLLKQRLGRDALTQRSTKGSTSSSSYCVMPPVQPVLSCLYGGAGKCTRQGKVDEIDDKEEDDTDLMKLDPELVAEPIAARSKSFVGTHEYLAPEVISGTGHGSAVDWWTLGVFLYEMIYGRTPFKGETNEKTLINIIKQPLIFPPSDNAETSRAQDLIGKLLIKNPKRRLGGSKGSVEIKRHEFFNGVNWALIRSVKPPEVPRDIRQRQMVNKCKAATVQKKTMSKKDRDEPFQIPQHFDYF